MTTRDYITLINSDYSLQAKFRVVMGSLQQVDHRQQSRKRTITGKSDSQVGRVYPGWVMTLRIHTEQDPLGYGLKSDLETFYGYSNPMGSPSTLIHFVDHLGIAHDVELIGDLPKENMTPFLDGPDAAYLITVSMEDY